MTIDDKRRYPRIPQTALVSYEKIDDDRAILEEGMGRTKNLSLGGLNLELGIQAWPDEVFLLVLNVEGTLLDLVGKVVWCEPDGDVFQVGFQIIKAPKEYTERLDRLFLRAD